MEHNFLYMQSGGPTAVINASAYGALSCALNSKEIDHVYAGLYGIEGFMDGKVIEIKKEDRKELSYLLQTPGAAFGSCRKKLKDFRDDPSDYRKIDGMLDRYHISYIAYNGGNDSMDTVYQYGRYLEKEGIRDRFIVGIPKTVDNDLTETDHTPGYGSAAKYIASSFSEIVADSSSYEKGKVNIVELMGRDAGWLTLSSSLADLTGKGPDRIYLPEYPFDIHEFLKDVESVYREKHVAFFAVSEGIADQDGRPIGESGKKDAFGHPQLGGVSSYLASLVSEKGYKVRAIELNVPQRCDLSCRSKTDVTEALICGEKAVQALLHHESGKMVALKRVSYDPYKIEYVLKDASLIGNKVRYIDPSYYDLKTKKATEAFFSYALPLIEGDVPLQKEHGLPRFFELKNLSEYGK